MTEATVKAAEKHGGDVEDVLGLFPDLDGPETEALDFYWSILRAGTPSDRPVDRKVALDLWRELHPTCDPRRLFAALASMDAAFSSRIHEQRSEEIESARRKAEGGRRKGR